MGEGLYEEGRSVRCAVLCHAPERDLQVWGPQGLPFDQGDGLLSLPSGQMVCSESRHCGNPRAALAEPPGLGCLGDAVQVGNQ